MDLDEAFVSNRKKFLRKVLTDNLKKCINGELHKDFPEYMQDQEVFERLKTDLKF